MNETPFESSSIDLSKTVPWNSGEYPVKVNSIKYNQDFTLLTLGTSKGYKIFSIENLKLCHEETEEVYNLGDIYIANTYYRSSLVFLLPSKDNENFTNTEIIIFDDFYQIKMGSFKEKKEEIINFFLSKSAIFIITLSKIIVMEILTFKIIQVITNINSTLQLLSFNFVDFVAYIKFDNKKNIYINHYLNDKLKITSQTSKILVSPYDFIQMIQLSPSGLLIGILSIYGNKMHIYYSQTGKLKECIFLGPNIQTIEKILFSKKENYFLFQNNDNKLFIYKIVKSYANNPKCECCKYDDKKLIFSLNKNSEKNRFWQKFFSKNDDIKNIHSYGEYVGKLSFVNLDEISNKNKDIILINNNGIFNKYHFGKNRSGKLVPVLSVQWI
jgi:hypothetical protein